MRGPTPLTVLVSLVLFLELMSEVERLRRRLDEAVTPHSPLAGQIRNLESMLKAREKEVDFLTR